MNYTSIEQSKKLLELGLNHKTSDMFYHFYWNDAFTSGDGEYSHCPEIIMANCHWSNWKIDCFGEEKKYPDIPCWSVGALLEVMPNHTEITKIDGLWTISASDFRDVQSDSLIDALVDKMILLLENNERAKKDFEYFYNNILVTEDKDGNKVSISPLKDYQKAFYKWLEDCSKRGIKAVCCPNTRFEFYRRND